MKLLLVEDDELIGDGTQKALAHEGFSIDWVQTLDDAGVSFRTHAYDVVILDIRLPDGSGLDLLRAIRAESQRTAILLLTALSATDDRVRGLDLGADDYLVKPFAISELCARIRAIHRRHQGLADPVLKFSTLELNPATHTLREDGTLVELGPKEFAIMQLLMERAGRVATKAELEEKIYSWGDEVQSNAVEVLIHRLRKKLKSDLVRTLRGVGYVLAAGGKADA